MQKFYCKPPNSAWELYSKKTTKQQQQIVIMYYLHR